MPGESLDARISAMKAAGGLPDAVTDRFARFIESAPQEDLFRMSPLRYARDQGIDELQAIDLFLHATHAGVLDFSWGVLCPMCASFLTTRGGLRSLSEGRRCGFCQIDVLSGVDDNVEVAFSVSPSVRRIRFHDPESLDMRGDGLRLFFSTSLPKDSVLHGALAGTLIDAGKLAPGQERELSWRIEPGRYVFMAPASHSVLHFTVEPGVPPVDQALVLLDGCFIPDRARIPAGRCMLTVRNQTKRAAGFLVFPDPIPPPEARPAGFAPPDLSLRPFLNGKRLITTQTFRELFRAESIPSEGGLELRNLTVLFTDLKGSTQMYERLGDLRAYDLVRRHFAALRAIVSGHGGAVVKTIGDAIMATFAEPVPGLRAAAAMNREIRRVVGGEDLRLKIGLHAGPCIAVELNDRLDYFGRTVNVAARVQGIAGASEIVCTEPVYGARGADQVIREGELSVQQDRVFLKGIAGEVEVRRLR